MTHADSGSQPRPGAAGRRLRLGMIGGGRGAFIGAVHRMAARLDDRYELVAGVLSSDPERARASAGDLLLDPERAYVSVDDLVRGERRREDPVDVVAIVTPNHLHYAAAYACLDSGFDVICDKPMTTSIADAEALCDLAELKGRLLVVTFNYSGYPLVRAAREMIQGGELGRVHKVQVEYLQDWLLEPLEETGHKQASWRTDPAQSGPAGSLADIGSHAFHLAEFVSGSRATRVSAMLATVVPGRRLDDDAELSLEFDNGATGGIWVSQVACGHENDLEVRVYGARGSLAWRQANPNALRLARLGEPPRVITRGSMGAGREAARVSRLPAGHPEGYVEAFAQIYRDAADRILAGAAGHPPPPGALLTPLGRDGLRGVQLIHVAVQSSRRGGSWIDL